MPFGLPRRAGARLLVGVPLIAGLGVVISTMPASAANQQGGSTGNGSGSSFQLTPGDLLVSTSTYLMDPTIVAGQTQLPPGCTPVTKAPTTPDPCGTAVANGTYPYVFNNGQADPSFGVTSPIVLQEITPSGHLVGSLEVPNSTQPHAAGKTQMVTSFPSKSELALNLSTTGKYVTFMGYNAGVDQADVSNSNTPGAIDPTSADPGTDYRVVGEVNRDGKFTFTETNAYTGDNGRAAIGAKVGGKTEIFTAGNAGNGGNPEPSQVVTGAGAQLVMPSNLPEATQQVGQPTPIGSFNLFRQLPAEYNADKVAKDNNYRGLTIENTVLYYTKGSGSNGVNTVYYVNTSGKACSTSTPAVGLPQPGATLPTAADLRTFTEAAAPPITKKKTTTANPGLVPPNMCILKGFPTSLAGTTTTAAFPFGIWFANPDTLYIAGEGNGTAANATASATSNGLYQNAAAQTAAGLQKWVLTSAAQTWKLAYTIQAGLNLGQPYTVAGYPTGLNSGTANDEPWAPATDGIRNITGQVNANGTVTIWGGTSTVSGSGDQGADPNQLVQVTDQLGATTLPSNDQFKTAVAPKDGVVVRGVSFTPGTTTSQNGQGPNGQGQNGQGQNQQGQNGQGQNQGQQ